ncbi:hypothetical protein [Flexivirga caeni]|uniref:Dephospho-CoA kinase n=1 Tax=Flexivirga caeni TaxID=2294115 RepID=A0A3M9MJ80_9MICO|nr:hypothetical protein [Flexivirga caeni]RNI25227.1 hypothetical protein EFY87_00880 [Flexivirga caeni]
MATTHPAQESGTSLTHRLRHVRWIAGGTASGKSTVAAGLVREFGVELYSGDRAEQQWIARAVPHRQPRFFALRDQRPGDNWRGRTGKQAFEAMPGRSGETVGFLVEDLLARPAERPVVVDYFGILPRDLAPLLERPEQAVFLVPTPQFRRAALRRRYADPRRARANWGDLDPADVIRTRLERDALWDAEVTEQAHDLGLPIMTVDGACSAERIIDRLGRQFGVRADSHEKRPTT